MNMSVINDRGNFLDVFDEYQKNGGSNMITRNELYEILLQSGHNEKQAQSMSKGYVALVHGISNKCYTCIISTSINIIS